MDVNHKLNPLTFSSACFSVNACIPTHCLKTLQDKRISAVSCQRVAMQTVETLQRIRSDTSFDAFFQSALKKKKGVDVTEPILKRQKQVPVRFATGNVPYEHPVTAKDIYLEIF